MQRLLTLTIVLLFTYSSNAQVRRPVNAPAQARRDTAKQVDIREKLVQLALQNPDYEIADRQLRIANDNLKLSRYKILGNVSGQVNLNEYSISQKDNIANFFPRYNLQLSLPFNTFFNRKSEVAIARENLGIAQASKNQAFREIRAQVLSTYEDYLMHQQKLEFQLQAAQDVTGTYQQKEKDFAEGIITQEEYNQAYKLWIDEQSRKAEYQRNLNVAKINLEMLIGVRLEDVVGR